MRSACSGTASGWQHTHMCQPPASHHTTGSFIPTVSSPGSTVVRRPASNDAGSSASSASTHQCSEPGVEQLTYTRQPPSGRRTSAGRSTDAAPKSSRASSLTVSNATPSSERATTTA